jgi:hypothetical protein
MDIIDYIEEQVELLGWVFSYGNKANQNLLVSEIKDERIYFLLDPIVTSELPSPFGGDGEQTFTGTFLLLVKSNIDEVYHTQRNTPSVKGKYNKHIKPLKTELNTFKSVIDCSDYKRDAWSITEIINEMDVNFDGLVISFTLKLI